MLGNGNTYKHWKVYVDIAKIINMIIKQPKKKFTVGKWIPPIVQTIKSMWIVHKRMENGAIWRPC